jgi:hypothetical protein
MEQFSLGSRRENSGQSDRSGALRALHCNFSIAHLNLIAAQWRKAGGMSTIEGICADLGITIAQCYEPTGPLRTKAGQTLRRLLLDHGDGHVIITLRTIVESSGNERALTASGIQGVSDLVLAHPSWPDHGLAWIEAFDNIDLIELAKMAKANCKAVPKREAMAAMLYERLAPIFDPPRKLRKHIRKTPRQVYPETSIIRT